MSHLPKVLGTLSRLMTYPDEHTVQAAELLYIVLQAELPAAAREVSAFGAFAEQHEIWELEEVYTRTFDVNPACALEVGWHLFGEEYARGMFLVRMREELRKYDLPESAELTDHLTHVLAVVAAMPDDEAARFVQACVQPAVEKMKSALEDKETPYKYIVACLSSVLAYTWGEPVQSTDEDAPFDLSRPFAQEQDPLRAFPVADVACNEVQANERQVELVPLHMSFPSESNQE
jgi:nitrate reductase delta subunit